MLATTASGVLYALSFPATAWHPLAWFALAPWLVALRSGSTGRALLLSVLWTLVATYGLNDWFPRAVSAYWLQPRWVGAAFFLGVTLLTAAPAFIVFALSWRRLARRSAAASPLLAAAAWVGSELLRTRVLGDPWALLGYAAAPTPVWLQVADLAGVYGTSFVLAAVNAVLAELWLRQDARAAAVRGAALVGGLVAATALYGAIRLAQVERRDEPAIPVAVVQATLDPGSQWRPELYGRNLDAYLRRTLEALRETPAPRLVVWPESALSFFLDDEPLYRAAIGRVLAPSGADLVAGGPRTAAGSAPPFHNTTFLLRDNGDVVAWYDKRRLLPFAEYFPLASADLLHRRFGRVREFTPGAPTPPLPTVAGPAGVVVCNEALFAEPARERVRDGARVLLALANDSWLGDRKYAEQAMAMTVVRAIEVRRPLVRASTAGPSAIVSPAGRVTARSAAFAEATLHGAVTPRTGLTPYARAGDAFALACVLMALIASAARDQPRCRPVSR